MTMSVQNRNSCTLTAKSLSEGSGAHGCGTSNSPNQYSGHSALTESYHQPDSGTRKISAYNDACAARAPNTCQRGIAGGYSGCWSNRRQVRLNTASARIVRPTDLCNV